MVGAATPPPRTNGMTTTTTARPTTTLATVDRHENPYLKMQALMPTPRQREFGISVGDILFRSTQHVSHSADREQLVVESGRSETGIEQERRDRVPTSE